jgi:hypothetical protein
VRSTWSVRFLSMNQFVTAAAEFFRMAFVMVHLLGKMAGKATRTCGHKFILNDCTKDFKSLFLAMAQFLLRH